MPVPYASSPYAIAITHSTGSLFDVTSECLRLSYSRTLADPFTQLRADEGVFEFANDAGTFSPTVNSAIAVGNLISLKYINVFSGNTELNAYSGRIKSITMNPRLGQRTTVIEALTDVDRLSRTFVDTPLLSELPVSSLFSEVMSRTTVASYTSDLILDMVDFAWFDNRNVVGILNQIVRSGYYTLHVDGAGTVRLRSRYYESLAAAVGSISVMQELNYAVTGEAIINKITARALPIKQSTDLATVAFLPQTVPIPASGHTGFWVSFLDPRNLEATPVGSIEALVAGTDYYASANADGSGADYTSTLSINMGVFGASAVASIFNGQGNDAWLRFQIRGYPVLRGAPLSVRHESTSSQNLYGLYEASFDDLMIKNYDFLKDLTQAIIGDRSVPRRNLSVSLINEQPLIWHVDVGDLLTVTNEFSQITGAWSVRALHHDLSLGRGEEHRVTFELREPANNNWLILDHNPYGEMDAARVLAP